MDSFLLFIDNTKPEVKIVSPLKDENVNGLFNVTGFARDVIGVTSLSWQCGTQSGEIELIPGNPFFTFQCDLRDVKGKFIDIIITATDRVGNITKFIQKQPVNQEEDKSTITVFSPVVNEIYEVTPLLHGLATDDDGIATIFYQIDKGEIISFPSEKFFTDDLAKKLPEELKAGKHSISIWAEDIHGIVGNKTEVPFTISGIEPTIEILSVELGTNPDSRIEIEKTRNFFPNIEIHPESKSTFKVSLDSAAGITEYSYQWKNEEPVNTVFKNPAEGTTTITIPVTSKQYGYTELTVTVKDKFGRETSRMYPVFLTNLSVSSGKSAVVFSDSTIGSDGIINLSNGSSVTGYFMGGKATKVEFEQETDFATIQINKNIITIKGTNKKGTSEPLTVKVTTDQDLTYTYSPIVIISYPDAPSISIQQNMIYDGTRNFDISGTVNSPIALSRIQYRIVAPSLDPKDPTVFEDWQSVKFNPEGNRNQFTISFKQSDFTSGAYPEGIFVIEIQGIDSLGQTTTDAIFARTISQFVPNPEIKNHQPTKPVVCWIEGENLYYIAGYSGESTLTSVTVGSDVLSNNVFPEVGEIKRASLSVNGTPVEVKITTEDGKLTTGKTTSKKEPTITAKISTVNNMPYISGMEVEVLESSEASKLKENGPFVVVEINSDVPVSSFSYSINGNQGKGTAKKGTEPDTYTAEIPLKGVPANIVNIEVIVSNGKNEPITLLGTVFAIRPTTNIISVNDTRENSLPKQYTLSNIEQNTILLSKNETLGFYGNYNLPIKAVIVGENNSNFSINTNERAITIKPNKEGLFSDVVIEITDAEGVTYTTVPVTIRADFNLPTVAIETPKDFSWIQNILEIMAPVNDSSEIVKTEYQL